MAFGDFQEFLADLDREGDLRRVMPEVDPAGEIAAITARVATLPDPPALFFERVRGSRFPLVTNAFGSFRRMSHALGFPSFQDLVPFSERLVASSGWPADEEEAWKRIADSFPNLRPKHVDSAPCREVIEPPSSIGELPFLVNFPGDGEGRGGYLTLPLVFTTDPVTGAQNCGIYRVQRGGGSTLIMGWHPGSGAAAHWAGCQERKLRMPVAVVLGGDPAVIFSAGFSFPPSADELHYAGLLRGEAVGIVSCVTSPIAVPAQAEVVIEGYVEPGETAPEGPFGNHTGFYAAKRAAPVMRITCITRKAAPVIPATVVATSTAEDCYMAKAAERLLLPWLRLRVPELAEIDFPMETIFHRAAVVYLRQGSDAKSVLKRLRQSGPLRESRLLVAVDDEVPAHSTADAFRRSLNAARFSADLTVDGERLDMDATRKPGQKPALQDPAVAVLVESRWEEYFYKPAANEDGKPEKKDLW